MRILIAAALLGAASLPVQAFADSPFDGTWKADLNSVHFSKKPDVYVLKDGMYDCKTCTPPYKIKADGSDQPVSGHPDFDTVAISVTNDHTVQETDKKDGKTVGTSTTTIAPDGKTGTVDFTNDPENGSAPVTGKVTIEGVAKGPAGSNAISGSWITTSVPNISAAGVTETYKVGDGMLSMTDPTGESYDAKIDGAAAPFKGNPGITDVTVKKMGPREMMVTHLRDGKVVGTATYTVSKSGNTMVVVSHNKLAGTAMSYKETKQ